MSKKENDHVKQGRKKASAIEYDGKHTPRITASGEGAVAEEMIQIAEAAGVPLYENPLLVDILSQLEIGSDIPEPLYLTMAEVISFAYYLKGKIPNS